MTPQQTLKTLVEEALHVGALLNSIEDVDAREAARERFETVLNDELFHGAQLASSPLLTAFGDNDTHSLRVEPMNKVQSLAEYEAWKAGLPS